MMRELSIEIFDGDWEHHITSFDDLSYAENMCKWFSENLKKSFRILDFESREILCVIEFNKQIQDNCDWRYDGF